MTDSPSTPPDEEGKVRELSALLDAVSQGHAERTDALFAAMHAELHRLARQQLYRNARGASLGATTLLHEAFIDLAHRGLQFDDRAGAAARSDLDPALSDALAELDKLEPDLAELVDLKYFCGFDFIEIADMRGVTERTVQRHWEKARLFLRRTLDEVA